MKVVYLAHPYGGKRENVYKSVDLATELSMAHPDIHFFNAAHYFYQYEGVLTEEEIMKRCLDMVRRCDELWLAPGWKHSKGCNAEHMEATSLGKMIGYIPSAIYTS